MISDIDLLPIDAGLGSPAILSGVAEDEYTPRCLSSMAQWYSARHLRFYARVTRFMFSAAISKSLELKRSYIPL